MDRSEVALSFRVLGTVAVLDSAGQPVEVGSPRRRAVLAALLVHAGAPLSVDKLVDLLWEAAAPPSAAAMVHSSVATLRRVLEPEPANPRLLVTAALGYSLRVDPAASTPSGSSSCSMKDESSSPPRRPRHTTCCPGPWGCGPARR